MKRILITTLCVVSICSCWAQHSGDLAMKADVVKDETMSVASVGNAGVGAKYTLESYANYLDKSGNLEEDHFLGGEFSSKWSLFMKSYKRVYEQSVGLSGSSVEILKPTVYSAVNKANSYFKKHFQSGDIKEELIMADLGHILDCANLLCFEEDTKSIEADLKNAKNPQDIIHVFQSIRIIYH